MRGHHERFRWTVATQNPNDPRELKYNAENEAELNSYAALTIVDKQRRTTVVDALRNWEKDAVYNVVSLNRSGHGFTTTGLELSSPEKHIVGKPSDAEATAVINFGKLIGSLAGGKIIKIPYAESPTGAIPVMDTQIPGKMFYYLPAQIEPLAMDRLYFEATPSYIIMKPGEMPSYVFWKRKADFAPSYTETELLEHWRSTRSGAPTPEPRPAPRAGPVSEARPETLAVNTDKSTEVVVNEKQVQPVWEVFDPRLEEDPIEFLDFYNACLHGRHGVRSKLMLREADIDRVNYISPCLAHSHKETAKETEAVATDSNAMDVDPVPTVPSPELPEASTSKPSEAVAPKPWKQPGPIAADDPSWKQFFARQTRDKDIRDARIRPKAVFTSEFCNPAGTKSDPKKAVLTRELYDKYYHRAVTADREIENRSKCCLACGLKWTLCPTTRNAHYKQHREEFKLHMKHYQKYQIYVDNPLRVEDMDPAKAPMPKGVPEINWFRDLEQIILNMENELLEREQTCRICTVHVDFADESIADHYRKHAEERKQLRNIGAAINSAPHTPDQFAIVTQNGSSFYGSMNSTPARDFLGFQRTPEYIREIERDQAEKKRARLAIAKAMEVGAQQLRETGTIQAPISISSGRQSSDPFVESPVDVMDTSADGPIHSDVIGNTTARLALAPLLKPTAVPKDSLDFLSDFTPSKDDSLAFLSRKDTQTVAPMNPGLTRSFRRFIEKERRTERENRGIYPEVHTIEDDDVDSDLDASPASGPVETVDDDTDLYTSPAPGPVGSTEQKEADFDQAEIIQAIRTNSGELFALNDEIEDSEDAEEEPEEFEVASTEITEEALQEFEFIESDDDEDFENSTSRNFCFVDHDDSILNQMVYAATHDLDLNGKQLWKAREFVQKMLRDSLGTLEELDPGQQAWVETMTRNLFVPHETGTLDATQELAAKTLAQATGHSKLRKMNLNLQQAFVAIDYAMELLKPVSGARGDVPTQETIGQLVDYLFSFNKKVQTKRSGKKRVEDTEFSFEDVALTTRGLLDGIRLELYDMWRVLITAKETFVELVAANGKDSLSDIKRQIASFTRGALVNTWRHGYKDEPFAIRPVVPVRHDGLDMEFEDLEIDHLLSRAHKWGCGLNNLLVLAHKAWGLAVAMIKGERASPKWDTPEEARVNILATVRMYVQDEIRAEKFWRRRRDIRFGQQKSQVTPTTSSAKWSTSAVSSGTPRTPVNEPWTPIAPVNEPPSPESSTASESGNKRKRPSPLPTPRKRNASDTSFHPGPPTPFNPDEVSPRMPKMPRRSNDPSYRPGPALLEPTTPPVTPKLNKRSSAQKAADRTAKKVERKLKKKQAEKAEKKKAKKVTFEAAQSSKPSSKASTPSSSKVSSPQVVITKKAAMKTPTSAPAKATASKSSKSVVKNVAAKSGVKKAAPKARKSDNVALAARPKRQAAIAAEQSFGKTRVVE
jgi:hypothetical protein